jgi:multiple sugar transport system permease protein
VTHVRPATESKPRRGLTDRDRPLAWLFLLPSVLYLVALVLVPLVATVVFAFSGVTSRHPAYDFTGLANFRAIFADGVFWRSLVNTLIVTGGTVALSVVFGKILANLLIARFRGRWLIRFLAVLPWTTPAALSALSWRRLLDPADSPIDRALRALGVLHGGVGWLQHPGLALTSVVAVQVWRLTPLAAIIMMAGLRAVPRDVEEAARVDGAGLWRRTFEVRIPLMLPMIMVAAVVTGLVTVTDLAVVRVLTGGGPAHSTEVLTSWAYTRGVRDGATGQGTAVALFLLPFVPVAIVALARAARRLAGWR